MVKRFDLDFRRLVVPQLMNMVGAHATLVRLELELWSEAVDACWGFGVSRGALHLSGSLARELAERIECELLKALERAPDPGVLTAEQLARVLGELR